MTTKWERTPQVPFDSLPSATLPSSQIPADADADSIVESCIKKLNSLTGEDLCSNSFWRDLVAFTNTFRTFHQPEHIVSAWKELGTIHQPSNFKYVTGSAHITRMGPVSFIPGAFTFKIGATAGDLPGTGSGSIGVVADGEKWKIWFLSTILEQIDSFGNPDMLDKVKTPLSMSIGTALNGTDEMPVDCLIVGAGQSGLGLLGRLKALGVRAVALEKHKTVGGNWTGRYDTVKLHTGKYYATLPYGATFHGHEYPYFLGGQDLARGFQKYVNDYGLDVRLSTTVESAKWDGETWTVRANQDGNDWTIEARHLVFAIGAGGQHPKMPQIPNREDFQGTAMHSVDYKYAAPWKGKKGVVVGTGNTGHDVAEDMVEAGLSSVTMVQRERTMILPFKFFERVHSRSYGPTSDVNKSDRAEFSIPFPVVGTLSKTMFTMRATAEPETFDGLERAGFRTELPSILKIHERQGGHYLDVGCSQKIIDGEIKVKGGAIESFTPTGLKFSDGSTLDADLIVFSTGYSINIREIITKIVGPEVGNLLEDNGGWDKEGEIRGAWKPHGHPAIWNTNGDLAMARFYSRFLAFHIKAALEGVPLKPYRKTP